MTEFEPYEGVCSTEEYFENSSNIILYDDIKYVLMNKSGGMIGKIFYFLTECRGGPVIYFINENGHYKNITLEDVAEEDEEYFGSYIGKRSDEYSQIDLVYNEFKNSEDESRGWKMAKEIVRLRNIIKSKETVVNNVVQNVQLPTAQNSYVYSDRTPIDGFDPNKPWSWVCNGCGSREYSEALSERDIDALACSECGDDEWHKEND